MKRAAIFAGTTEGRQIAVFFASIGFITDVFVATEYGRAVLPKEMQHLKIHEGRMGQEEMARYLCEKQPSIIVDATHPYAIEVTSHIKEAAKRAGLTVYRLVREGPIYLNTVCNAKEAVQKLKSMAGNILLTTGSKDLEVYCQDQILRERLFVRVLPSEDSIRMCRQQGILPSRIIAMQGPFSMEMNIALIRQFQINILVTKNSGTAGGFSEKLSAAKVCGIEVVVIDRPLEDGFTIKELQTIGERMAGI